MGRTYPLNRPANPRIGGDKRSGRRAGGNAAEHETITMKIIMRVFRRIAASVFLGLLWLFTALPAFSMTAQGGAYHLKVEVKNSTDKSAWTSVYVRFKGQNTWEPTHVVLCLRAGQEKEGPVVFQTVDTPVRLKYRFEIKSGEECSGAKVADLQKEAPLAVNDGVAKYKARVTKSGDSYELKTTP